MHLFKTKFIEIVIMCPKVTISWWGGMLLSVEPFRLIQFCTSFGLIDLNNEMIN